jgi:hypothetical protein
MTWAAVTLGIAIPALAPGGPTDGVHFAGPMAGQRYALTDTEVPPEERSARGLRWLFSNRDDFSRGDPHPSRPCPDGIKDERADIRLVIEVKHACDRAGIPVKGLRAGWKRGWAIDEAHRNVSREHQQATA